MNDLREDLDRALRDVVPGEPPVAGAIRRGKVIRVRRRGLVLASVVAAVAAVAAYPALARHAAAPAPPPAQHLPAPHHDPVVIAFPVGKMGPGGMVAQDGVIGGGRIGASTWQAAMTLAPGKPCFIATISGGGFPAETVADTYTTPPPLGDRPAAIATFSDGTTQSALGRVGENVAYLIVTFRDGQQLKLIPVTWNGTRYVAWLAPQGMTVSTVVAHLGGPYFDSGQQARVTPTALPG